MNLMSVDVSEIQEFCVYSHYLWCMPLEILISTALLFTVLGYAALVGLVVMILSLFAGFYLSRW